MNTMDFIHQLHEPDYHWIYLWKIAPPWCVWVNKAKGHTIKYQRYCTPPTTLSTILLLCSVTWMSVLTPFEIWIATRPQYALNRNKFISKPVFIFPLLISNHPTIPPTHSSSPQPLIFHSPFPILPPTVQPIFSPVLSVSFLFLLPRINYIISLQLIQ